MLDFMKKTIESVQGVKNCKIIEENGEISQIFVEADLQALSEVERTSEIKSIVRSVIGAVAIKHNVELDYRKIKVIEYKHDEVAESIINPRIRIVAAYQKRFPKPECVVQLHCFDQEFQGTTPLGDDVATCTFNAFCDAFNQIGLGTMKLKYIHTFTDISMKKVLLVKLEYYHTNGATDTLMGVTEVDEDLPLAVVKATLDAINRRILIKPSLPTRI